MTIEEYLENTKRHLSCFNPNEQYTLNYTFEEILDNKEYFQECLNKEMSTYTALLFYEYYIANEKPLWDNYKNKIRYSSNVYDRKFELLQEEEGSGIFKILGDYSFNEFFKMIEIDNDFKSRWGHIADKPNK